jgi:hypothetical protein
MLNEKEKPNILICNTFRRVEEEIGNNYLLMKKEFDRKHF